MTSKSNHYQANYGYYIYPSGFGYGSTVDIGCDSHECCGAGGGGWYGGATHSFNNNSPSDPGGSGGSGYVNPSLLSNAQTIAGSTSFVAPSGGNETGHTGNGYARITAVD